MSKSIALYVSGKLFGVFSNKSNAFRAIESQFDVSDLCIWSDKKNEFLPLSYGLMALRLSKVDKDSGLRKCVFYPKSEIDSDSKEPVKSIGWVYQMETNVGVDGVLYKGPDKSRKDEDDNGTDTGATEGTTEATGATEANEGATEAKEQVTGEANETEATAEANEGTEGAVNPVTTETAETAETAE